MEELYAARYNIWWYLSFFTPFGVMILATFWHKKSWLVLGVVLSVVATYSLCNLAVQKKWHDRLELAETDEELSYATRDGANLVFTALVIGPFEAILYTSIWGVVGWRLWPKIKTENKQKTEQTGPGDGEQSC